MSLRASLEKHETRTPKVPGSSLIRTSNAAALNK